MYRVSRAPLAAAVLFAAASMMFLPVGSSAIGLTPEVRSQLTESSLVTPALIDALEQQERVAARIYFVPPAPQAREGKRWESRDGDMNAVVIELAQAMLPGSELGLLHFKTLDALQGSV